MSTTLTAVPFTNISNISTTAGPTEEPWRRDLQMAYRILLPSLLAVIMLAMGCDITIPQIKINLKQPWGVLVGLVCQFVLLPATVVGLAFACQLSRTHAIGMLVLGCCPGGTVSNIFTYWVQGDLSLSVCMTTFSTVIALGMMPLNLFIYARIWTSRGTVIPFTNIAISLVSILVPVSIGMLIRWKFPKAAKIVLKVGSAAGILCIAVATVMNGILYPNMFSPHNWKAWLAGTVLPFIGFGLGFALARVCRLTYPRCRTVGFETGCQNVSLALTLVLLSFGSKEIPEINLFPLIYGIIMMVDGFVVVGIYKLYIIITSNSRGQMELDDQKQEEVPNDVVIPDVGKIQEKTYTNLQPIVTHE